MATLHGYIDTIAELALALAVLTLHDIYLDIGCIDIGYIDIGCIDIGCIKTNR